MLSCSSTKYKIPENINSASDLLLHKIEFTEHQLTLYENGKKADFSEVNILVNLSTIEVENWEGNWSGTSYIPNRGNINNWKEWFKKNKENLYFNPNNQCLINTKISKKQRKNIIFLKTNSNELRSSISSNMAEFCKKYN
jgi:hypothetical protein